MKLTGATFDQLTSQPRNYSLFVIMTTFDPNHRCVMCKEFDKDVKLVAQAFGRQKDEPRVFLGQLDFADGRQVFSKLNILTVPYVLHYPPTEGPRARVGGADFDKIDLNRKELDADAFVHYIDSVSGVKLTIRRPINWTAVGIYVALLLSAIVFVRLVASSLLVVIQNRKLWTVLTLGLSILFCSGHMWNNIRSPAYNGGRNGQIEIFQPGFQSQYVIESQIVGLLYAATAVVVVGLITKVPTIQDPLKQRTAVYIGVALFLTLWSYTMRVFRYKNGGYPYKLFF
ncbi:oligosaccharyl transferase subunit ost3/OST6 [Rhizophlyctis rosea]|uniref:Oligosaccharyl transferase subunit ost3/OST6 n=1 Tax=Rhizophlyctis rosea TaxID=64517 RepID=A0AAD5SCA6_9FUNG|nr:oligosaccharyl transferase subunit ost3/OST6 [Rhizophlyctis rosea]